MRRLQNITRSLLKTSAAAAALDKSEPQASVCVCICWGGCILFNPSAITSLCEIILPPRLSRVHEGEKPCLVNETCEAPVRTGGYWWWCAVVRDYSNCTMHRWSHSPMVSGWLAALPSQFGVHESREPAPCVSWMHIYG